MNFTIGHDLAPTVFWGHTVARGAGTLWATECFPALILMGDWCGPSYGYVTTMTENQGAELQVTLSSPRARKREHEKNVHGEVQLIDTSLLMGDPFSPLCSTHRNFG